MIQKGFSVVELLVVLAIIGILAATAIANYQHFHAQAYDAEAEDGLRQIMIAEEAYYGDHEVYKSCAGASCFDLLPASDPVDRQITLTVVASPDGYTASARHPKGSGRVFTR